MPNISPDRIEDITLALADRKRRLAALLRPHLKVALELKALKEAISLAKLIILLEGFGKVEDDTPDPPTPPSPELSRLLESAGIEVSKDN